MPAGRATELFRCQFAFTQDLLLTHDEFVREAADRGYQVTGGQLRVWHETGLLKPLLFIAGEVEPGSKVTVPPERMAGANAAGDAVAAAREGRLRDGADVSLAGEGEESSGTGQAGAGWLYSEWQLLGVDSLPPQPSGDPAGLALRDAEGARARTEALCGASWWALPPILDSICLPDGADSYLAWQEAAGAADPAVVLDDIGWSAADLRSEAERLLVRAHNRDPNRDWLALVRHVSPRWWRRLRGPARDAIEHRIAAEVLLAAYERLAERGDAQPLPDLSGGLAWQPLHGRLAGPELGRIPLDQALSMAGLSPHPRAVLLVEGESEAIAARLLLAEIASEAGDWTRVHALGGATADPKMLARFAAAPALASPSVPPDDTLPLARPPTALVIHVDPEGRWHPPERAERERKLVIDALDAEVRSQGATASRQDLAALITVDIAPPGGFEYANFSDDELAEASASLSGSAASAEPGELMARFAAGRRDPGGINRVLGQLRISKLRLSAALAPRLIARLPGEIAVGATTPIIRAVLLTVDVATSMPRGQVILKVEPRDR